MPTYQYACPDCGAEFEKVQKFSDNPIKKCPTCGKTKVHRVINRISVAFRGSGFYINDSKSSSSSSAAAKKEEPAKADGAESTTTSESSTSTDKAESTEKAEKTEKTESTATTSSDDKPAKKTAKKKDK
jgi:putative FmdB family regulatory protein